MLLCIVCYKTYLSCSLKDKARTLGWEHAFLVMSAVHHLDIELFRDSVDSWDLVIPCAICSYQSLWVTWVFLLHEISKSLYKSPFYLWSITIISMYTTNVNSEVVTNHRCDFKYYWTCPRSTAGFMLCPQSYTISTLSILVSPVRIFTSTCNCNCILVNVVQCIRVIMPTRTKARLI